MTQFPKVVGFSAEGNGGKSFMAGLVANYVMAERWCLRMALADHFKIWWLGQYEAMPVNQQREFLVKWNFVPTYSNFFDIKTPESRHFLQQIGTEFGRDKYGIDIWVRCLHNWMLRLTERNSRLEMIVLDDVRFVNEWAWVNEIGGIVIRLNGKDRLREGANGLFTPEQSQHRSEREADLIPFRYVVDNGLEDAVQAQQRVADLVRAYYGSQARDGYILGEHAP